MKAHRARELASFMRRIGFDTVPYHHSGVNVRLRDEPGSDALRLVYGEVQGGFYVPLLPLRAGDVVVDIGAHVGGVSIPWAVQYPQVQFHCFEPDPLNYANLVRNKIRNSVSNVHVHRGGLSGRPGFLRIRHDAKNTGSSIAELSDAGAVPAYTLQEIVARVGGSVRLLKLDCEGAEHDAIQHIGDLNGIHSIIAELHETETHPDTAALRRLIMQALTHHRITTHTLTYERHQPWTSRGLGGEA